jgi:SRSO17 transposase
VVPAELTFQTEPQLALEMLGGLVARGELPYTWVVADEHDGMIPRFLDGVEALGKRYVAEVPTSTRVWRGEPQVEPPGPGPRGRPRTHPRVAAGTPKAEEVG